MTSYLDRPLEILILYMPFLLETQFIENLPSCNIDSFPKTKISLDQNSAHQILTGKSTITMTYADKKAVTSHSPPKGCLQVKDKVKQQVVTQDTTNEQIQQHTKEDCPNCTQFEISTAAINGELLECLGIVK